MDWLADLPVTYGMVPGGQWYGICDDLQLAVAAPSWSEAQAKLEEAVRRAYEAASPERRLWLQRHALLRYGKWRSQHLGPQRVEAVGR